MSQYLKTVFLYAAMLVIGWTIAALMKVEPHEMIAYLALYAGCECLIASWSRSPK